MLKGAEATAKSLAFVTEELEAGRAASRARGAAPKRKRISQKGEALRLEDGWRKASQRNEDEFKTAQKAVEAIEDRRKQDQKKKQTAEIKRIIAVEKAKKKLQKELYRQIDQLVKEGQKRKPKFTEMAKKLRSSHRVKGRHQGNNLT